MHPGWNASPSQCTKHSSRHWSSHSFARFFPLGLVKSWKSVFFLGTGENLEETYTLQGEHQHMWRETRVWDHNSGSVGRQRWILCHCEVILASRNIRRWGLIPVFSSIHVPVLQVEMRSVLHRWSPGCVSLYEELQLEYSQYYYFTQSSLQPPGGPVAGSRAQIATTQVRFLGRMLTQLLKS